MGLLFACKFIRRENVSSSPMHMQNRYNTPIVDDATAKLCQIARTFAMHCDDITLVLSIFIANNWDIINSHSSHSHCNLQRSSTCTALWQRKLWSCTKIDRKSNYGIAFFYALLWFCYCSVRVGQRRRMRGMTLGTYFAILVKTKQWSKVMLTFYIYIYYKTCIVRLLSFASMASQKVEPDAAVVERGRIQRGSRDGDGILK